MTRTICAFTAGFTLACCIGWGASPKYVNHDGNMHEPVALITLGFLSSLTTVGTGTVLLIKKIIP